MAEKINWNYVVQALDGPSLSAAGDVEVDGYDKLKVTLADNATQQVDLVPSAAMLLLIINPASPSADLSYEVNGNDVMLDGPQVFIGTGAVSLIGGATNLTFTNKTGADAVIEILIGRDTTP